MHRAVMLILISLIMAALPVKGLAQEQGLKSIGIRTGFMATEKHRYFHQYEAFTEYKLPLEWRMDSGWGLGLQLNSSAGALYANKTPGFIATLGPGFSFDKGNRGFAADIGPSLVFIERQHFDSMDFSGKLQFLIHLGLTYRFDNGLGIGYRIQHMSNGGIYKSHNPGLDFHMAALSYNF